ITGDDKTYIVFGGTLSSSTALASLSSSAGRILLTGGLFSLGDINNDGYDDLGAAVAKGSPKFAEGTAVLYRQAREISIGGVRGTTAYTAADILLEPAQAIFFDSAGYSRVSDGLRLNLFGAVGDLNGDGFTDLVQADRLGGASHVIFGRALTNAVP